jgi:hypothetical protein
MAAISAQGATVVDGRYLVSSAALTLRPDGPVEALDTRSGRAAQVRLVFVDAAWSEEDLADAVTRWCGLGCSEACGILDFGRHEGRWFLVLPPSLGVPLERWRMMRRPTPAGAAELAAAVGDVLERVAAAGFAPGAAEVRDLAVGPGPTPFLDRPLLGVHGATARGDGQAALARVLAATAGGHLGEPFATWEARARSEEFPGLGEAVQALRGAAAAAESADTSGADAELDALFDGRLDPEHLLPPPDRLRPLRRAGGAAGIVLALVAVLAVLPGRGAGEERHASPPHIGPASAVPLPTPAGARSHHVRRHARHVHHPPRHLHRRDRHAPARHRGASSSPPPAPPPAAPSSAPAPAPQAPAPSAGGALPAPGELPVLPAPG